MRLLRGVTQRYSWRLVEAVEHLLEYRLARTVAYSLPKPVAYWCTIRVGAHATTGPWSSQNVPELTLTEALERWSSSRVRER